MKAAGLPYICIPERNTANTVAAATQPPDPPVLHRVPHVLHIDTDSTAAHPAPTCAGD